VVLLPRESNTRIEEVLVSGYKYLFNGRLVIHHQ
jgi:hypothetical protein